MRTLFRLFFNQLLKRERFSTLQFYLPLPHMFKKNTTLKSNYMDIPFKANVKHHIFLDWASILILIMRNGTLM